MTDGQVRDPVCGMVVDPSTATLRVELGRATVYFCSETCKARFVANPGKYLSSSPDHSAASESRTSGAVYTCPMHPQIRRDAPGNCLICGMTLELVVATQERGPSPELRNMTRRFWVGTVLA
ncbi:MAG: heavy metal-binding domain-containing protein, partial [Steroidobacteraceae bacterium]